FFIIAVQTPGSGISIPLAVGTPSTGSGNLYCQWELSPSSSIYKEEEFKYIQMMDYALWDVIENGHTFPKTQVVEGVTTLMPITSIEDKAQRRLEVKARSTLMTGIPNEHQLKFNSIKVAKQLMEAIEKIFGENAATKKTQRNILKQQYENFTALNSEILDQTFDRLQKLNTHVVVWRNKADLDTMSMDYLYNNLKVYEPEVKGMSSSNSSIQNMAFVSSSNNNSTNRAVNTTLEVSTSGTQVNTVNIDNLNDLKEKDLRWQIAMLTMRGRRFLKKTRRKLTINGNATIDFDKTNVECYNCHKREHFARECRAPKSQDTKHKKSIRRTMPVETPTLTALVSCDETVKILKSQNEQLKKDLKKSELMVLGYKSGLESLEERLKFFKTNESIYLKDIKLLKVKHQMKDIAITELRRKLDLAQKEKDNIQLTIDKLKNTSKSLNKLIDYQIVGNCKKGSGYENYNADLPPYTRNFMPPKPDLSFTGIDKFSNKPVVENCDAKTSETKPKDGTCPILHIMKKLMKNMLLLEVTPKEEKSLAKAEAVNTACYVQNRVIVVKPYNMTLYELFHGRIPALSFMKPFRCPVTIFNTLDHLGKFDGKADEGFFVRYSVNSKAFRVFNIRKRIVEENLHIRFSKNTPNVLGSRPDWLFDIDALTRTINYEPIAAGTQSNDFAGTKACDNAGQARKENEPVKDYILLPLWIADLPFSQDPKSSQDDGFHPSSDNGKEVNEDPSKGSECKDQEQDDNVNNTNMVNAASTHGVNAVSENISNELPFDPNMPALKDISTFNFLSDHEDDDEKADMNNMDTTIQTLWCTRWMSKVLFSVKRLKKRFHRGKIDKTLFIRRHKGDILLVQVYVDDVIFGSTKKELCIGFEKMMHEKFQMSFMGELTLFLGLFTEVKNASTPIKTQKPLLKDEDGKEVDVHMYRSGLLLRQEPSTEKHKYMTRLMARSPTKSVADEVVFKELDDSLVRAATNASSLKVEQDSGNINKTKSKATPNESSSQGTDSGGGPRCQEAIRDTISQTRSERVSKLLMIHCSQEVGLSARIESFNDNEDLGENASKQEMISDIDVDEGITVVSTHDDAEMFDADKDLHDEEVFVAKQDENVVEKEVDAAQVQVSIAATTPTVSIDEVTLAQALAELKHTNLKAKAKGIVFHEPEESTTTKIAKIPKPKS
nr:ribonuclease H-like domain-containing protein [Tanacetum cinerariifolium]